MMGQEEMSRKVARIRAWEEEMRRGQGLRDPSNLRSDQDLTEIQGSCHGLICT